MTKHIYWIAVLITIIKAGLAAQYLDADWIFNISKPGVSVTINCKTALDKIRDTETKAESWLLNRYQQADVEYDDGNVRVINEAWSLHIESIQWDHMGYYSCISENSTTDTWSIRFALNPVGNLFDNIWDRFRWNVIIGAAAAGCFAVLVTFIYIIYKCRWQPDEEWSQKYGDQRSQGHTAEIQGPAIINPAYEQERSYISDQHKNSASNVYLGPHSIGTFDSTVL